MLGRQALELSRTVLGFFLAASSLFGLALPALLLQTALLFGASPRFLFFLKASFCVITWHGETP
ncbi:hypothetical protein PINS_up022216 [Pythium insidiosum]|nr:hypothetical protein PINS_up022216 [Pythium insidiosum]